MQAVQTLTFVKKRIPSWARGTVATPAGAVYRVSSDWTRADTWGMIKARGSAFRMTYSVPPGLYAVGDPTPESDVFVTANYKMTFDVVRRELAGMHAWLLVLDTKSINVWCAAGKGTFGTDELVNRIAAVKLDTVISHRRIILPQLGAVGVNGPEVQKRSGFRVAFGPVQARDIPAYVRAGYRKTEAMRTIAFPLLDRLVLTPMELNPAFKKIPWFIAGILLLFGIEPQGILFKSALFGGLPFLALLLASVLSGAFLTPVLLPFIPFRSFALKGWLMGLVSVFAATHLSFAAIGDRMQIVSAYLFFPALSSYLALQFTGSTTFTGMSGVQKELKVGIPIYISAAVASLVLIIASKLNIWGVI